MAKTTLLDTTPTKSPKIRLIVRASDASGPIKSLIPETTFKSRHPYLDSERLIYVFVEAPSLQEAEPERIKQLEDKFNRLVKQWRDETEHISSLTKMCMHRAYQHIIGMGYDAVPLLLRELQQEPDQWFWALHMITEDDPAESEDTFDGAVRAWLDWGKREGYL